MEIFDNKINKTPNRKVHYRKPTSRVYILLYNITTMYIALVMRRAFNISFVVSWCAVEKL